MRALVRGFKDLKLQLPLTSHILCGISGGSDSVALGVALARYGRRIVPAAKIRFVHVNHGWRGAESDADEAFVRRLAQTLEVPLVVVRARERPAPGESWEDHARRLRLAAFDRTARELGCRYVVTAHTGDDLAETRLWRLFTGKWETHGEGILSRHGNQLRPLLQIRKHELQAFLREEGIEWREDSTNHEGRFLRSKMRQELLPAIERIFPRAVSHLMQLAPKRRGKPVSKGRRIK